MESSVLLQEWEGVVLDQEGNCFTARLHEGQRDFPAKRATIPLAEVSDNQQKLVVPGSHILLDNRLSCQARYSNSNFGILFQATSALDAGRD